MSTRRAPLRSLADPRRWPIRAQLAALALAVALPAAGLVAYALAGAASEARNAAFAQVQYLAESSASRLDFVIRDNLALLERVAQRPQVRNLDPRACDPLFQSLVSTSPYYASFASGDRRANIACSSRADPLGAAFTAEQPWFAEVIGSGEPTISDAFRFPASGQWVAVLAHPLVDEAWRTTGLLTLSLDLGILQERLFDALPEGALVSVLDRRNVFLMRSIDPGTWIGRPLPGSQAGRVASRKEGDTFETTGVDGVTRMYATAIVPSSGWRVFAALPRDVVFAAQRERMLRSAGIGVVVLAAIIALAVGIGMAIARPIDKLARAATAIRGGAKRPLDPVQGSSEVTAVAGELARLADEHERGSRERVALVNHYERILKSVRDIYLLTDESRRIVDFNDAAVEAYGYAPSELRGKNVTELRAADARESFTSSWDDVRKLGGSLFETVHQRRDGSRFAVEVSASSIEIAGVTYRQALVRDISARKATEDLLRQQNEELERFNRAAVGREMDVIELKRRINELARELGREPPFPLTFLDPRSDDPGAPS